MAIEGTLLHRFDADPSLGRARLTRPQCDLLEISARLTREAFVRIGDQFGVVDQMPTASGYEREMYLHRGIKSLYSGHCDVWEYFADKKLLIILEKKFGYLSVDPAASNLQARTYACMGAELHDCEHVAVAITAPRLSIDDRLTLAVYGRKDIAAAKKQLFAIWDACQAPDAPLIPGESQCRYCLARTICPALRDAVSGAVAIMPATNGLTKTAREVTIENRIKQASDAELSQLYNAVHLAGFVKDPLFDEMRARINNGGMPGFKLGKAKEQTEITDVARAIDILEAAGLPREKLFAACSMATGEDGGVRGIWRDVLGGTWKDAKEKVHSLLADVIEKSETRPSVLRNGKALTQ